MNKTGSNSQNQTNNQSTSSSGQNSNSTQAPAPTEKKELSANEQQAIANSSEKVIYSGKAAVNQKGKKGKRNRKPNAKPWRKQGQGVNNAPTGPQKAPQVTNQLATSNPKGGANSSQTPKFGKPPPRLSICRDGDRSSGKIDDYLIGRNLLAEFETVDPRDTTHTITRDDKLYTFVVPRVAKAVPVKEEIPDFRKKVRVCPRGALPSDTTDHVFVYDDSLANHPHPCYYNARVEAISHLALLEQNLDLPYDTSLEDLNNCCEAFALIIRRDKPKYDGYKFSINEDGILCMTDDFSGHTRFVPSVHEACGPTAYVKAVFVIVRLGVDGLDRGYSFDTDVKYLVGACSATNANSASFPVTLNRQIRTARRNHLLLSEESRDPDLIRAVTQKSLQTATQCHEAAADFAFMRGYLTVITGDGSFTSNFYCLLLKLTSDVYGLARRNVALSFAVLLFVWTFRRRLLPWLIVWRWFRPARKPRYPPTILGAINASLASFNSQFRTNVHEVQRTRNNLYRLFSLLTPTQSLWSYAMLSATSMFPIGLSLFSEIAPMSILSSGIAGSLLGKLRAALSCAPARRHLAKLAITFHNFFTNHHIVVAAAEYAPTILRDARVAQWISFFQRFQPAPAAALPSLATTADYTLTCLISPLCEEAVRHVIRARYGRRWTFVYALGLGSFEMLARGADTRQFLAHCTTHAILNAYTTNWFMMNLAMHVIYNSIVYFSYSQNRGTSFASITAAHRELLNFATDEFSAGREHVELDRFFTPAVCGADSKPYNLEGMSVEGNLFEVGTKVVAKNIHGENTVSIDRVDTDQRERCNPRLGAALLGIGLNNTPWTFFSCQHNEFAALCDRFIAKRRDATVDLHDTLMEFEPNLSFPPVDMDWAAKQPGKKFASYTEDSKTETGNLTMHKTLIKRELSDRVKTNAVPRMIGTSSASSNYYASALIHTFISDFVETVNSNAWLCTYFMSCDQIAAFLTENWSGYITFVSLDGARMDAHIDPTFNDVLSETLSKYPCSEEGLVYVRGDRDLDTQSMRNRRYKFTGHAENGLSSGVQWTAANHCYYMYLSWQKFCSEFPVAKVMLVLNKGDDLLMLSPLQRNKTASIVDLFRKQLDEQGLTTTVDFATDFSEAEFLSCRFYHGPNGDVHMVPKIGRLLAKLCWTCYPHNITDPLEYSWCLGKCLEHLSKLDIVGPFVEKLLQFGSNRGREIVDLKADYIYKSTGSVNQNALAFRVMLTEVYGLTETEIDDINNAIMGIDSIPAFLYVESFNKVLLKDWTVNNPPGAVNGVTYAPTVQELQPCSVYQALWTRHCANNMSQSMCNEMIAAGASPRDAKACQELVANGTLTENGLRWLCTALCCHPKSGGEMPPGKWPGSSNNLTTVRTIQKQVTVTQPQTLASDGTWNIVGFFMPYLSAPVPGDGLDTPRDELDFAVLDGTAVINPIGGMTAIKSGWNLYSYSGVEWDNLPLGSTLIRNYGIQLSTLPADVEGPTTLVSTGLVVTYTGQTLLRDGALTAATLPGRNCDFSFRSIETQATTQYPYSSKLITAPALQPNDLTRYPQSRTWHASEAVYCQPTCYDLFNNYSSGEPYTVNVFPTTYRDTDPGFTRTGWSSVGSAVGPGKQTFGGNAIPWTQPQFFIRGLTASTEFTATARYVIQSTPDYTESEEVVFAQVPAPMDLRAFKIYSEITSGSSMIFPYGDNPSGKWFGKVMSSIAKYAPLISDLAALGLAQPEIAVVGNTVGALAGVAGEYYDETQEEETPELESPVVGISTPRRMTRRNSTKNQRRARNVEDTEKEILKHLPDPVRKRGGRRRRGPRTRR